MRKKILSLLFVIVLLMALAVPAFAGEGGCPNGRAGLPGRGSDGLPGDDMPTQAQRDGHGPGHGPLNDNSAHGSGPGQKNTLRGC